MDNVANNRTYIRGLYVWLFLAEMMSWNGDDFHAAVQEARGMGRGVPPEEVDEALNKLHNYLTGYLNK